MIQGANDARWPRRRDFATEPNPTRVPARRRRDMGSKPIRRVYLLRGHCLACADLLQMGGREPRVEPAQNHGPRYHHPQTYTDGN